MRINDIGVDISQNRFSLQQLMEFFVDAFIGIRQDFTNDFIISSRLPKCPGLAFVAEIIDDRPGIEDFCLTKFVSIVSGANFIIFIFGMIIPCHLLDFFGSETEILAVFVIKDCVDLEIVQSTENTFFGHT